MGLCLALFDEFIVFSLNHVTLDRHALQACERLGDIVLCQLRERHIHGVVDVERMRVDARWSLLGASQVIA